MTRANHLETIRRINSTLELCQKEKTTSFVLERLQNEFKISKRQAYRYLGKALQLKEKLILPEIKQSIILRIPEGLIYRLHKFAQTSNQNVSQIVASILEDYLRTQHWE